MNLELITVCVLLATSSSICLAMVVAWLYLGRHPYALMWAGAAGGAVLQWIIVVIGRATVPDAALLPVVTGILVIVDSSLIALAFRHRAHAPTRLGWYAAFGIATSVAVIHAMFVLEDLAWRTFLVNCACAILILTALPALLVRGRRAQPLEAALALVLLLFACFEGAIAALALRIGADGIAPAAVAYRVVLGVGLPASYVAMGIGAVMLLVADLASRLEALTTRDPVTGALNRRGLDQAAVAAMANARRHKLPLSVMVIELLDFPAIAGRAGRAEADRLLILVADQLNAAVREEDVFAHYDRARFCVLLAGSRLKDAQLMAMRACADLASPGGGATARPQLAARYGVAQLRSDDFAFGSLLRRAEAAIPPRDGLESAASGSIGRSAA